MGAQPEVSAKSVRAKNVRRVASQVLAALHLSAKVQQLYAGENDNVRKAYDGFAARLEELFSFERTVTLHLDDGYLFVNDVRLRIEKAAADAHWWVLERFAESGLASITFDRDVKPPELKKLVPILVRASWPENGPAPRLAEELQAAFIVHVRVHMRRSRELDAGDEDQAEISGRHLAIALWMKLHRAAIETCEAARRGQSLPLKKSRALVQVVIDALQEDEASLLAMTRLHNHAPEGITPPTPWRCYLESHMANTCILSLALGVRLGVGRRQLLDLGAAALSADVGMVFIAEDVREREGPLEAHERGAVKEHALRGAETILRGDDASRASQVAAAAAATHHLKGYLEKGVRPSLHAAIIAIADAYDAMTTDRPWRKALSHADALKELLSGRGGHARLLVKVFANVLGLFPVGAVVELTSGETAVVTEQQEDPKLAARPRVKVLLEAGGKPSAGRIIDLAERSAGGVYPRAVASTVDVLAAAKGGPGDLVALL